MRGNRLGPSPTPNFYNGTWDAFKTNRRYLRIWGLQQMIPSMIKLPRRRRICSFLRDQWYSAAILNMHTDVLGISTVNFARNRYHMSNFGNRLPVSTDARLAYQTLLYCLRTRKHTSMLNVGYSVRDMEICHVQRSADQNSHWID